MAVSSTFSSTVAYTGDLSLTETFPDAANGASPGQIQILTLSSGDNTITPPSGGTTPVGVIIIPPASNPNVITLKGVGGDTGVPIHKTLQTKLSLNNPAGTFILNAAATVTGLRLVWL